MTRSSQERREGKLNMKKILLIIIVFLPLLLVPVTDAVKAENSLSHSTAAEGQGFDLKGEIQKQTIFADEQEKKKESHIAFMRDFMGVAFSNTFWNQDRKNDYPDLFAAMIRTYQSRKILEQDTFYKGLLRNITWLNPYVQDVSTFSRFGAVNKWTRGIAIGIDWPRYEQNIPHPKDGRELYQSVLSDRLTGSYPEIQNQVEAMLPELSALTGLSVRFVAPNDPVEITEGFARVRIIPVKTKAVGNFFKSYRDSFSAAERPMPDDFEYALIGAVPFTSGSRAQVDGYFIPDSSNAISLAICKINPAVGSNLLKALVSECLVRALGLPELSENEEALLGAWNKAFERPDGLPPQQESVDFYNIFDQPYMKAAGKPFPLERLKKGSVATGLSEYDRKMLRMLYCPQILPGMDKYQVFTLLADGSCAEE